METAVTLRQHGDIVPDQKRDVLRRFVQCGNFDGKGPQPLIKLRKQPLPQRPGFRHRDHIPEHQNFQQLFLGAEIQIFDEIDLYSALSGAQYPAVPSEKKLVGVLPRHAVMGNDLLMGITGMSMDGMGHSMVKGAHRLDDQLRAVRCRKRFRQCQRRLHFPALVGKIHKAGRPGLSLSLRPGLSLFEGFAQLHGLLNSNGDGVLRVGQEQGRYARLICHLQHRCAADDQVRPVLHGLYRRSMQQLRVLHEVFPQLHTAFLRKARHVTGHVLEHHQGDIRRRLPQNPLRPLQHIHDRLRRQHDLHHRNVGILLDDGGLETSCDDNVGTLIDGLPRLCHGILGFDDLHDVQPTLQLLQHVVRLPEHLLIGHQKCDFRHGTPPQNSRRRSEIRRLCSFFPFRVGINTRTISP